MWGVHAELWGFTLAHSFTYIPGCVVETRATLPSVNTRLHQRKAESPPSSRTFTEHIIQVSGHEASVQHGSMTYKTIPRRGKPKSGGF